MSHEEEEQRVIEDWRDALENLSTNARHEIISLTSIARDYTSYAYGISESLEEHIKKAPPQRKLPLIYLLDSIVKNIGTPYTLFFGKNLYQTFMDAYASVNDPTRRKMEEMLKTWKEPVPGSIDKTPVFPADSVRPIETALIKARTSALQAQQEQMRTQQQLFGRGGRPSAPYRATPTPPNARQPFNQPPYPGANGHRPESALGHQAYQQHQNLAYPGSTPQPPSHAPAAAPYQPPQTFYGAPAAQAGLGIDSLNNDIEQLIVAVGAALGRSPHSPDIQTEFKALLALQGLLRDKHKTLPQEQVMAVRNQVEHLAVKYRVSFAHPGVAHTPSLPATPFHAPMQQQQPPLQPHLVAPAPPASAPPSSVSLDALLGKGALAALLSRQSATPQPAPTPSPQVPPPAVSALRSPTPQRAEPAKPATPDPMALLGALRSRGLLPATPQPGQTPVAPFAPPPAPAVAATTAASASAAATAAASSGAATNTASAFPPNLASILAQARSIAASAAAAVPVISSGEFSFKASSLKQPRLHHLPSLYEALGPPCSQCGRRFLTNEEGKKKKTAHMDWHFRVHQRMIDAEKRGQHRSWYVDEADWVRSVESIDLDHHPDHPDNAADAHNSNSNSSNNGGGGGGSSAAASGPGGPGAGGPRVQYIPVPDDGDATNSVCPICQEKFETKWLDEAQEWVWTDALRVGGRAYHASCYAEVTKGGGGSTPMYSRATPDPVLGKRKAEDEMISVRGGRVKTDI